MPTSTNKQFLSVLLLFLITGIGGYYYHNYYEHPIAFSIEEHNRFARDYLVTEDVINELSDVLKHEHKVIPGYGHYTRARMPRHIYYNSQVVFEELQEVRASKGLEKQSLSHSKKQTMSEQIYDNLLKLKGSVIKPEKIVNRVQAILY